jgi:hypothetical protein
MAAEKLARALGSFLLCCICVPAAAQLETRSTTPALIYPQAVVAGDFNNDGKTDLAVASVYNDNGITLLLGNGNGTFGVGSEFTVGAGTDSLAAADFNGDGNLDLAVVQYLDATVSILFGNGDGTFQTPINYATPVGPTLVAAGDFNGDKIPDLIVLDYDTCHCLSVFLNNGDGTFGLVQNTAIPFPYGQAIGLGDFNGDGKLDVVTAGEDGSSSSLQVFLGNGDGTFTDGAVYNLGNYPPQSFAVASLRGNGILDLVMPGGAAGSVAVFLGNGDGTFQPETDYPAATPKSAAVADFNGDGKPDIAVSNDNAGRVSGVSVLLGNGDGTFQQAKFYAAGDQGVALAVADFNGDKKPDVALADGLYSYVTTMLNTGVVSFSPTTPVSFPLVLIGNAASQNITLTNTGTNALTISSMKVSGQFGMTSTCGSSVAAGANCNIKISFSPHSINPQSGLVTINDSASSKPQVIEISGQGTVVKRSPTSLNFGSQKVGTKSAPQTVTITNTGAGAITISSIYIYGGLSQEWTDTSNCPASLGAGANCTISVTFDPQQKGKRPANISITDNGGGSPQSVPLSGTGD